MIHGSIILVNNELEQDTNLSNIGKWDRWYELPGVIESRQPFGKLHTYHEACSWFEGVSLVADWGCGKGYFGELFKGQVIGIDGSHSPYADVIADLTEYKEKSPGILIRHVLEHEPNWRLVLKNALTAFTDKAMLIFFIAPGNGPDQDLYWEEDPGVPNLRIDMKSLHELIESSGCNWSRQEMGQKTIGKFGREVVYKFSR